MIIKTSFVFRCMFRDCIPLDSKVRLTNQLGRIVNYRLAGNWSWSPTFEVLTIFCSYWLCWLFCIITEDTIFFQNSSSSAFKIRRISPFSCCRNNYHQTIVACCAVISLLDWEYNNLSSMDWMFKLLAIYLDRNFWACELTLFKNS